MFIRFAILNFSSSALATGINCFVCVMELFVAVLFFHGLSFKLFNKRHWHVKLFYIL